MKNKDTSVLVFALGGLGEIGKNMYVVETNNDLIIIDAGVMFPEDDLLGIDYVIQDITYLKQKEKKIRALFITHGHEDHIGGITYLLNSVNIPKIYAPRIAKDLIEKKLIDRNVRYDNLEVVNEESIIKYKEGIWYGLAELFNSTYEDVFIGKVLYSELSARIFLGER